MFTNRRKGNNKNWTWWFQYLWWRSYINKKSNMKENNCKKNKWTENRKFINMKEFFAYRNACIQWSIFSRIWFNNLIFIFWTIYFHINLLCFFLNFPIFRQNVIRICLSGTWIRFQIRILLLFCFEKRWWHGVLLWGGNVEIFILMIICFSSYWKWY